MRYIELNKEEYLIRELDQLKVKEYNKLLELSGADDDTTMIESLLILTELERWQLEAIELFSLYAIDWTAILQKELRNDIKLNRKYVLKHKEYKLEDFELTPFGKFIDIDSMISAEPENMSFVIAILLSPREYDLSSITKLQQLIEEEMNIQDAYSLWYAFISWRTNIFKNYEGLFKTTYSGTTEEEDIFDEDEEKNEEVTGGNQWMDIAYSLTNEDITKKDEILKKGIIEILNWLSYLKEKSDREKEAMKNKNPNIIH